MQRKRALIADLIRLTRATGARVEGEALVSSEGFSPRYDLDRTTGVITKIGHALEGESLKDRILITPTAKGGVAAGWAFLDLKSKGFAPKGIVFGRTNPVMVQGAVFADLAISEGWQPNALECVRTGDWVRLDPRLRTLRILRRS